MSPIPTKTLLERNITQYLRKRVKECGGEVRKVRWIGRRHAPDDLVMLPGQSVWVESKRPKKEARVAQAREHDRMRKAGNFVVVINTREQVDELMKALAPRAYEGVEMVIGTPREIGNRVMGIDVRDAGIAYEGLLRSARAATEFAEKRKQELKEKNTVDVTPGRLVDKEI